MQVVEGSRSVEMSFHINGVAVKMNRDGQHSENCNEALVPGNPFSGLIPSTLRSQHCLLKLATVMVG